MKPLKETVNYTLLFYEFITSWYDDNKINSNMLRLVIALFMFPVTLFFMLLALLLEEPLKCLFAVLLFKVSPQEALIHYKTCWVSLVNGMRSKTN